jgi:hypothetical protein
VFAEVFGEKAEDDLAVALQDRVFAAVAAIGLGRGEVVRAVAR